MSVQSTERTGELETLLRLFHSAQRGSSAVGWIEGAAGTGKTSLLQAVAERAFQAGAVFLNASASRVESVVPFSVIRQLLHSPHLTPDEREIADTVLAVDWLHAPQDRTTGEFDIVSRVPAAVLSRLAGILLDISQRATLVIGVDDAHHADLASLQVLLFLTRQAGNNRVLVLMTECVRATRSHPLLHADLLHLSGARRIQLTPLSPHGVATTLAARLGGAAAVRLAGDFHAASGGNPLLLKALIDDLTLGASDTVVYGESYRQAVLTCLYHAESTPLAQALAVLDEDASPALVEEFVHRDAEWIGQAALALRAAGLTSDDRLRHPAVSAAILGGMRPALRAKLQTRAAEILHSNGAPSAVVARHLLAPRQTKAPWAIQVLREAAGQALGDADVHRAVGLLKQALRDCDEEDQGTVVRLDLARAEWQANPACVVRHLPYLVRGVRAGTLPAATAVTLASWMLWLGRAEEAQALHAELAGSGADLTGLALLHPGIIDGLPATTPPATPDAAVSHAVVALREHGTQPGELMSMLAIATLIHLDRIDQAERACDVAGPLTPLTGALLHLLRASILLRRGALEPALAHARDGLVLVPTDGWGVAIGTALAVTMSALTAMGRHEEAEEHAAAPVPEAMYQTPHAALYLHARGRHHLATNRPELAAAELARCGTLLRRWGMDVPSFVPWRADLAMAHLALGEPETARTLAGEQYAMIGSGTSRTHGITLRALAAVAEPAERQRLLRGAVKALERCGDRLELSRALGELSALYRERGKSAPAHTLAERARVLAAGCGVVSRPAEPDHDGDPLTELSEAERRVAALAAQGYTNSQIAHALHVTTSTVEQHLTRVYRKLKIKCRADLPLLSREPSQAFG
ncbi:AAA family ATPase [Nonomuraea sp. B12E4]|uniref:helix-turn-helix transcriptional regulator n=1 Tax=Nonomuraea sp. B12E4 TaxID=3153564 RepID=UPI00325E1E2E